MGVSRYYELKQDILLAADCDTGEITTDSTGEFERSNFKVWDPLVTTTERITWVFTGEVVLSSDNDLESISFMQFKLKSKPGFDLMQLKISLPWGEKQSLLNPGFISCYVKLSFRDELDSNKIIRYVNVEPMSENRDEKSAVNRFVNDRFCTVTEMQNLVYDLEGSFLISVGVNVILNYCIVDPGIALKPLEKKCPFYAGIYSFGLSPEFPFSDVLIKVLSDEGTENETTRYTLRGHKCILAAASPKFLAMLTSARETSKSGVVVLQNCDCSMYSLSIFLKLLYDLVRNNMSMDRYMPLLNEFSLDVVLVILKLSEVYEVQELKDFCIRSIVGSSNSSFTPKSALELYTFGYSYDMEDLRFRSCQWIKRNKTAFYSSECQAMLRTLISCDVVDAVLFYLESM